MSHSHLGTIILLLLVCQAPAQSLAGFENCMKQRLGAAIVSAIVFGPGTSGYHARLGWSYQPNPVDQPIAFVDCNTTVQIASAVICANMSGVGVCP